MHELYQSRIYNYDVALLQLDRPIQMSNKARAVCLPRQGSRIRPGSQCYLTGLLYLAHRDGNQSGAEKDNRLLFREQ